MPNDPRIRSFICIATMGTGIIACMAAMHSELDGNTRFIVSGISIALVIIGFILHFILVRCPHCGRWIRKPYGEYCRYCGKEYMAEEVVPDDDYDYRGRGFRK